MILLCGKCQNRYEMQGKMIGQPDLEGIFIQMSNRNIEGTDLNICPECAVHALAGTHGFRRKGNIIWIRSGERTSGPDLG